MIANKKVRLRAPFFINQLFNKTLKGAWCAKKRAPTVPPVCPPSKSHYKTVACILGIGVKRFAYSRKAFWV